MNKGYYPGQNGLLIPSGTATLSGSINAATFNVAYSGDISILGSTQPPVSVVYTPVSTYPPGLVLTPTYLGSGRWVIRPYGLAGASGTYNGSLTVILADGQVLTSTQNVTIASQDPLWATMQFALHGNGTNGGTSFPDAKGTYTWSAYTGAITSTAQSKFNGSSIFTAGNAGIVTSANFPTWASNQWCVDFWLFVDNSVSGDSDVIVHRPGGGGSFWLLRWINSTTKLRFVMNNGSNVIDTTSTATCSKNAWHYIRIQRRSIASVLTMEQSVDGVYGTSGTDTGIAFPSITAKLGLGVGDEANNPVGIKAYFAEIRGATGVRDTGSNFTPPTSPFPEG